MLTLEHNFPLGSNRQALVDINLLLGSLASTDTRIGEWVNVMGYVTRPRSEHKYITESIKHGTFIQAVVLWAAGSVKLQEYERSLTNQLQVS